MNVDKMSLCEKLKYYREKKGFSQAALSKLSGVSVAEICRIEKGERQNPSIKVINKILRVLEVDSDTYIKIVGFETGDIDGKTKKG